MYNIFAQYNDFFSKFYKDIICNVGISIFLIGLFPAVCFAYTPPIGIPDPGDTWEGPTHPIDTKAPSTADVCPGWPSSVATNCYYIDNTDPNATDTNNDRGYPGKPRLTVPEITYPAGSYVEVHGGPYTDQYLNLSFHGTPVHPCWFRGTPGSMPIFPKSVIIKNSSYTFIEYLDFNGGTSSGTVDINGESHNVSLRYCQFRNKQYVSHSSGLGIKPDIGDTVQNIIVYSCNFEELGDWDIADGSDPDFHGITPSLWGRDSTTEEKYIWILENTFYHLSGNGVQVVAGNWQDSYKYLHHIYIGRNTAHALRQAGFWSKQGSDIIMSENTVYDNHPNGGATGTCIGYQYRPNNLWIIDNICYDVNIGIRASDDSYGSSDNTAYIVGNKLYHIYPPDMDNYQPNHPWRSGVGISLWTGGMHRWVVDNTMYDCYNGINAIQSGGSSLELSGNIVSNAGPDGWDIFMFQNVSEDVTIYKTLIYNPNRPARIRWGSHEYNSMTEFKNATGLCPSCPLEQDPKFVNGTQYDFRLQPDSPAIDANNSPRDVYDLFQSLYGINIRVDFNGVPRPQGSGWDMGAFEYDEGQRSNMGSGGGSGGIDGQNTLQPPVSFQLVPAGQ